MADFITLKAFTKAARRRPLPFCEAPEQNAGAQPMDGNLQLSSSVLLGQKR